MESSTTLQVHCPRGLARTIIAPALPRLLHQHRELSVCIQEYDRPSDFTMTAHGVVLSIGDIPCNGALVYPLSPVRLVTCASKEFIAVNGMPMQPSDLNPRHCIQVCRDQNAAAVAWEFQRAAERRSTSPASSMIFADEASAAVAAMRGGGFVQLQQYEVEGAIACGLLAEVLAEWSASRILTMLAPRSPAAEFTRVQMFLHFLRTLFPAPSLEAISGSHPRAHASRMRSSHLLELTTPEPPASSPNESAQT